MKKRVGFLITFILAMVMSIGMSLTVFAEVKPITSVTVYDGVIPSPIEESSISDYKNKLHFTVIDQTENLIGIKKIQIVKGNPEENPEDPGQKFEKDGEYAVMLFLEEKIGGYSEDLEATGLAALWTVLPDGNSPVLYANLNGVVSPTTVTKLNIGINGDFPAVKAGDNIEEYEKKLKDLKVIVTDQDGEIFGDDDSRYPMSYVDDYFVVAVEIGGVLPDEKEFEEGKTYYALTMLNLSPEEGKYANKVSVTDGWKLCVEDPSDEDIYYFCRLAYPILEGSDPTPTPTPTPKPSSKTSAFVYVDKDTYKSSVPSKTVIAADTLGAKSFFDLKVHSADEKTEANQKFLAQTLLGANVQILLTENIYPSRDLSLTENGSLEILTWNNLPKNQIGPVFAIVYNQIDGAYVINGVLDANGTATFAGFKLRSASTITICK